MTTPRRYAKGEGHRLRDDWLTAAAELLDETGDATAVSMRAVARRVGRSTPLIYEHFVDRDELVFAAARHALDRMGLQVDADLADEPDVDARLRRRAHAYADFARLHAEAYRVLFMDRLARDRLRLDEVVDMVGLRGVVRDLEEAAEHGLLAGDPPEVAVTLWAALHGVVSLMVAHPSLDWPSAPIDTLLDRLRDGLAPR